MDTAPAPSAVLDSDAQVNHELPSKEPTLNGYVPPPFVTSLPPMIKSISPRLVPFASHRHSRLIFTSSCHPLTHLSTHFPAPDSTQVEKAAALSNTSAFRENSALLSATKDITREEGTAPDPNPAGPTPTDEISPGIAPAADFMPSNAPILSHPTPPPEKPLVTEDAVIDAEMTDEPAVELPLELPALPKPDVAASATSAEVPAPTPTAAEDALLDTVNEATAPEHDAKVHGHSVQTDGPTLDVTSSGLVRPREDDEDDEPAAKRSKVESPEDGMKSESAPTFESMPANAPAAELTPAAKPVPPQETAALHAPEQRTAAAELDAVQASVEQPTTSTATDGAAYCNGPMTPVQKEYLVEKTKNLKKTKHALFFLAPVDPVKLNIPTYYDIVKHPMDVATMETKLKNDEYATVQDYANDLGQIVTNSKVFNGDAHPVTIAANNMEAYFKRYMETVPGPDQPVAPKMQKKASPAAPRPQPRREARLPPPPPPPPPPVLSTASPATANPTFALQPNGTPQIRRDSTTKRPHRTIKPPQNRELPYAKPKRKEHQLELKFCEHVLEEVRGPSFAHVNHVFLMPVDPVALNIPHYRQVVKKPMDLATMAQKLKSGQYGTAKEFRADFEQMVENCLAFNPPGNPVRDLGIEMRRGFEAIWKDKESWERTQKSFERASSASAESEEEEEEEEDDADAVAMAQLTKQLADLQKTMAGLQAKKSGGKAKKPKDVKKPGSGKKASAGHSGNVKSKSVPAKAKPPKKARPLTYDEKQEISSAVGRMNTAQVEKLTQIITDNCEKYRHMGDDMELEIDDLPNDVQALLLKHVRSIFGNPNRGARAVSPEDVAAEDDDDFAPPARDRAAAGGKRKKHKPMGKKEQQENINELRNRLAAFNNPTSGSESPTGGAWPGQGQQAEDTSGDEESEESEEE